MVDRPEQRRASPHCRAGPTAACGAPAVRGPGGERHPRGGLTSRLVRGPGAAGLSYGVGSSSTPCAGGMFSSSFTKVEPPARLKVMRAGPSGCAPRSTPAEVGGQRYLAGCSCSTETNSRWPGCWPTASTGWATTGWTATAIGCGASPRRGCRRGRRTAPEPPLTIWWPGGPTGAGADGSGGRGSPPTPCCDSVLWSGGGCWRWIASAMPVAPGRTRASALRARLGRSSAGRCGSFTAWIATLPACCWSRSIRRATAPRAGLEGREVLKQYLALGLAAAAGPVGVGRRWCSPAAHGRAPVPGARQASSDRPGPETHPPVSCGGSAAHRRITGSRAPPPATAPLLVDPQYGRPEPVTPHARRCRRRGPLDRPAPPRGCSRLEGPPGGRRVGADAGGHGRGSRRSLTVNRSDVGVDTRSVTTSRGTPAGDGDHHLSPFWKGLEAGLTVSLGQEAHCAPNLPSTAPLARMVTRRARRSLGGMGRCCSRSARCRGSR